MSRHRLVIAPLLLAALATAAPGCSDASSGGDLALQEALSTTAGRTEGRFSPGLRPLDGATPHRLTVHCTMSLIGAAGTRSVAIERTIDRGDGGRFRAVDHRTATVPDLDVVQDGREAVFDGTRLASRRRFGPWIERDLLHGGHERELRDAYDLGAGVLAGFGDYIRWEPAERRGEERLAGLSVRWAAATLDPRVAPRPLDQAALGALRDHLQRWPAWVAATHRPTAIEGTVARTRGGEVVAGRLAVSGDATVEGLAARFSITLSYELSDLPKQAGFELPPDTLPEARERTWRMIRDVLGPDLAAPYARP